MFDDILGVAGNLVEGGMNLWQGQQARDQMERLQREAWSREDTAVQRRKADLEAAGLAPQLAAGGAASSSPAIAAQGVQSQTEGVAAAGRGVKGAADFVADAMSAKSDIARSQAESERLRVEQNRVALNDAAEQLRLKDAGSGVFVAGEGERMRELTRREALFDAQLQTSQAAVRQSLISGDLNALRAKLIEDYGLSAAKAELLVEEVRAKQAQEADLYFRPDLAPGSLGGALLGPAADVLKGGALLGLKALIP